MKVLWYVYSHQVVSGPYSTENVEKGLANNKWSLDALVWRKGQREWLSIKTWQQNLDTILETIQTTVEKTVWYVEHAGTHNGPMNANELKDYLSENNIFTTCKVWTMGMHKWKSLFDVADLLQVMPVTRRKYTRAPICGNVFLKGKKAEFFAKLEFIGEGGMGAKSAIDLKQGELFDAVINSPMLAHAIHTKVIVANSTSSGAIGFQFVQLLAEPQSAIVSFVKQFGT